MGWELEDVEEPFVGQLQALGWTHVEGSLDDADFTDRANFIEVIQEGVLHDRLRALNPGPAGQHGLDDAGISEAVGSITRRGTHKLMEANQNATELLNKGLTVEGLPGWDGGRGQTIRYIDWVTPANNRLTLVNQYRVDLLALDGTWIQRSRNG
jgi:type I restriction enzyme R subunit